MCRVDSPSGSMYLRALSLQPGQTVGVTAPALPPWHPGRLCVFIITYKTPHPLRCPVMPRSGPQGRALSTGALLGAAAHRSQDHFAQQFASATHSHPRPPTATHSHPQPPMATHGHLQPPTATYSHPRPPTATHSHLWPPMATYGHPQPPMATYGQLWPLMATHGQVGH